MILGNILSIGIVLAICFGSFAIAPRTRRGLCVAVAVALMVLLALNFLGSALVGPVDLRPMLVLAPITVVSAIAWYFWKVKPQELANG